MIEEEAESYLRILNVCIIYSRAMWEREVEGGYI